MKGRGQRRIVQFLVIGLIGFSLILGGDRLGGTSGWGLKSATAQVLQPEAVAANIYERFPDLPLENQYINQNTGEAESSTLVGRIIRYHQYVKRRPNGFRLDWKLTLADYLGVNEPVEESRYPGHVNLQVNPYAGDIEAVKSLDLRQRNEIVEALVSIYDPEGVYSLSKPTLEETEVEPSPSRQRPSVTFPQPGDADLLLP